MKDWIRQAAEEIAVLAYENAVCQQGTFAADIATIIAKHCPAVSTDGGIGLVGQSRPAPDEGLWFYGATKKP